MTWQQGQALATVFATVVSATATVVLAVLTVLTGKYVRWTARMVNEMKQTREPSVFVDLSFDEGTDLDLILGNTGPTAARNVRLSLNSEMPWVERHPSRELPPVLRQGLAYLAPNRILRYRLGAVEWKKVTEGEGVLDLTLTFENELGIITNRSVHFDAAGYSGASLRSFREPLLELADEARHFAQRQQAEEVARIPSAWMNAWCPTCGELVKRQAKKCPHCLEPIPQDPVGGAAETAAASSNPLSTEPEDPN